MKKLMTLFIVLVFTTIGFSQTAKVEGNKASLDKMLSENYIEFVMPEGTTSKDIEKSAQYYTDRFNVQFDEGKRVAKLKMIENNDMTRRVINRFLLSANIEKISFDGKEYKIMEFYSNFLE